MADAPHTEGPGLGQPPDQQAKHMTWSRRFVQRLGAYEWYNPNRYYAGGRCNPRDDGSAYHMYANDGAKEGPTTEPSLDAAWSVPLPVASCQLPLPFRFLPSAHSSFLWPLVLLCCNWLREGHTMNM